MSTASLVTGCPTIVTAPSSRSWGHSPTQPPPHRILIRPALLLLASLLTGCQHTAAAPGTPTTVVHLEPTVLHTGVKRLGINLSGQTFYDSGQMLRNVTFRNPGFEAETWQSILHCKAATDDFCVDQNEYTQWPAGFLDGAHFEVISGIAQGTTGTVSTSLAAGAGHGFTLHLASPAPGLKPGDFLLVRTDKPGDAQAGWWTDLKGGASLATEFRDLSPATPGTQALRIEAAAPGQTAVISSFFDSFAGRSFLQLRGLYTLRFRAKSLRGPAAVNIAITRLDTTHGAHTFFARELPLTPAWHDYTFTFNADEPRSALGTVGLSFTFAHTAALLDDVSLEASAAPDNPTAFRNEVVSTLRALRPGVLRYMDNGANFGSSLDNLLAVPFARRRPGASTQEVRHEDVPYGLHEFLVLCAAVGAEPWFSMPPGTSRDEAAHLVEYLAGDARTPYGARRTALGQPQPWTSIFPEIHLELGNEEWNARSFAGSSIDDPTAYGKRAAAIFSALRASPGFRPDRFDLILGSWATVPWWTGQEIRSGSAFDSVAVAPYLFPEFNDASSPEAIFGPMFAEPESISSRPTGYMAQQLAAVRSAAHPARLAVYETNLGTMSGSATQADLDRTLPSLGAGLAVADHMLLMLRDLGVSTQCLFALPEFQNDFDFGKPPRRSIPLWGAVVDMGGATDARRPQFLAEQLANQAILPTMLSTHLTGDPTANQPLSLNGKIKLDGAHLLQTFSFADGAKHSLLLLNLSRTRALPVTFAGPTRPVGTVHESLLTAPEITAGNEHGANVTIRERDLASFQPDAPYTLPPFSMTVLTWTAAGAREHSR